MDAMKARSSHWSDTADIPNSVTKRQLRRSIALPEFHRIGILKKLRGRMAWVNASAFLGLGAHSKGVDEWYETSS